MFCSYCEKLSIRFSDYRVLSFSSIVYRNDPLSGFASSCILSYRALIVIVYQVKDKVESTILLYAGKLFCLLKIYAFVDPNYIFTNIVLNNNLCLCI